MAHFLVCLCAALALQPLAKAQNSGDASVPRAASAGMQIPGNSAPAAITPGAKSTEAAAHFGKFQLHWGRIDAAQALCLKSLEADPANQTAIDCLNLAASMAIDDKLNTADNLLNNGKRPQAADLASSLIHSQATPAQQSRARKILHKARPSPLENAWAAIPEWIRQILIATLFILLVVTLTQFARWCWTSIRASKKFRRKTIWNLLPLRGPPDTSEAQTATDGLLDAIARLGDELDRMPWQPHLLLLRPTPPANYEPAVISEFLGNASQPRIVMTPEMPELKIEWNFHEVRLDEAVQNLQLKAASGIDLGSLLRFLMAMGKWISAGTPTISGTVEKSMADVSNPMADRTTGPDVGANETPGAGTPSGNIFIHLAARGVGVRTVSITTSSEVQPGIDCVQLAAERAAFKFLIRMMYSQMTNDEVNGLAALRQGVSIFSEFAGTIPDAGGGATTRASSLKCAARNLAFFRSSIPIDCEGIERLKKHKKTARNLGTGDAGTKESLQRQDDNSSQVASIKISDEIRQTVLLAEGMANALTNDLTAQNTAIDCFRQLQEWPGSPQTLGLRQQAAYNEAIVRRELGFYGQCVLMMTEVLGERVPGTEEKPPPPVPQPAPQNCLPDAIRYAARLARLAAFAQYTREDWSTLPDVRAQFLIDGAVSLVKDLESLRADSKFPVHDLRMAQYMHTRAMRAYGHVELRHVIKGPADRFYDPDTNRPTRLLTDALDEKIPADQQAILALEQSVKWMRQCEEFSPSCELYCDISESYLLLKCFSSAQAYGRHATLETSPSVHSAAETPARVGYDPVFERAFYLAAESYFLSGDQDLARSYAARCPFEARLDEFKALRAELGVVATPTSA
jgi:hypothetical protein